MKGSEPILREEESGKGEKGGRERGGRRNAEEGKVGAGERECDGGRTMSQLLPYLHATSALTAATKTDIGADC